MIPPPADQAVTRAAGAHLRASTRAGRPPGAWIP